METLQERLMYLLEKEGVSAYWVSKQTGISESTISRILSGKTKSASMDTCIAVAKYFGVSAEWLHNGEGDMVVAGYSSVYPELTPDVESDIIDARNYKELYIRSIIEKEELFKRLTSAQDEIIKLLKKKGY